MRIEPATDGDTGAVVALWHAAGLVRPWNDPVADLALARAHPGSEVLVARPRPQARRSPAGPGDTGGGAGDGGDGGDGAAARGGAHGDGGVLGAVVVGFDGHRGWLHHLAVHPEAQGAGAGRALVAAAEHWLVGVGAPKVQLMVRTDNTAVLGFYERLGYQRQDAVVLGRRLS